MGNAQSDNTKNLQAFFAKIGALKVEEVPDALQTIRPFGEPPFADPDASTMKLLQNTFQTTLNKTESLKECWDLLFAYHFLLLDHPVVVAAWARVLETQSTRMFSVPSKWIHQSTVMESYVDLLMNQTFHRGIPLGTGMEEQSKASPTRMWNRLFQLQQLCEFAQKLDSSTELNSTNPTALRWLNLILLFEISTGMQAFVDHIKLLPPSQEKEAGKLANDFVKLLSPDTDQRVWNKFHLLKMHKVISDRAIKLTLKAIFQNKLNTLDWGLIRTLYLDHYDPEPRKPLTSFKPVPRDEMSDSELKQMRHFEELYTKLLHASSTSPTYLQKPNATPSCTVRMPSQLPMSQDAPATIAEPQVLVPADLSFQQLLGEGAQGKVYEAKWKGITVAAKIIKREGALTDFGRELESLLQVQHPNIVSLKGYYIESTHMAIVMEWMSQGSLQQVIHNHKLTWSVKHKWALDAALGVQYLHQQDPVIIHRDLKTANLLVDKHDTVKVADFGLVRFAPSPHGRASSSAQTAVDITGTCCGTPGYVAPEILQGQRYSSKVDVYSYGMILWALYAEREPAGIIQMFPTCPIIGYDCPEPWKVLIEHCCDRDPHNRPDFNTIVTYLQIMDVSNF